MNPVGYAISRTRLAAAFHSAINLRTGEIPTRHDNPVTAACGDDKREISSPKRAGFVNADRRGFYGIVWVSE